MKLNPGLWRNLGIPRQKRYRMACKPGSVLILSDHGRPFLWSLRCRRLRAANPESGAETPLPVRSKPSDSPPYSALLPVGFAVPPPLLEARWALTPPFHPCRLGRDRSGGLFSVALSLSLRPPVISRHRISVEPGLSSRTAISRGASGRPAIRYRGLVAPQPRPGSSLSFPPGRRRSAGRGWRRPPAHPRAPAANGVGRP